MKARLITLLSAMLVLPAVEAFGQQAYFPRLAADVFDAAPPTSRVRGTPGQMTVQRTACRTLPTVETRRRIVDVAVQEWAFFGFSVVEPEADEFDPPGLERSLDRGFSQARADEAARVAASIAGYWAVTPEGAGIVGNQNRAWNANGLGNRWVAPWSAAFISWVMCEAGLGATNQFQRAVAHWTYIDQAIRAGDDSATQAAFVAYDPGEAVLEPGDLLCASRRPAYRNLAERRRQMGEGARSHCDVVVKVDGPGQKIFAIGGNVRRAVSMKQLSAVQDRGKFLRPVNLSDDGRPRPFFAHLKLRAKAIEANAFDNTPTIKALACTTGFTRVAGLAGLNRTVGPRQVC